MNRKRTNLDSAEADFLYSNTLVEFNKYDSFKDLIIPERNNLIDEICVKSINQTCRNKEHIEAVTQEVLAYRLSKEEEMKFYDISQYTSGFEKQENFNELLKKKYINLISELVSEVL